MIYSMTGFGSCKAKIGNKKLLIEIKSLNSKTFDCNMRIPLNFQSQEIRIRKLIYKSLKRGKVDFYCKEEDLAKNDNIFIDKETILEYIKQLKSLPLKLSDDKLLSLAISLPNTFFEESKTFNNEQWKNFDACLDIALKKVIVFRKQEGMAMKSKIKSQINSIQELTCHIEKMEPKRTKSIVTRISKQFEKFNFEIDKERLDVEMIYYIEKSSINEELIRLKNHCQYFHEVLEERESQGKKLNFIAQEIGREINTLGSKANCFKIQHTVVRMKEDLDNIKEQILNIL